MCSGSVRAVPIQTLFGDLNLGHDTSRIHSVIEFDQIRQNESIKCTRSSLYFNPNRAQAKNPLLFSDKFSDCCRLSNFAVSKAKERGSRSQTAKGSQEQASQSDSIVAI